MKIVERFRVGGNRIGGPSLPSSTLQKALGTIIRVNIESHTLTVPTREGYKTAHVGDTILCYEDATFDVEKDGEEKTK